MNSDIKDHSNDAQQEAQGLEVVAWLNTSSSEATTYTPTVMDWDDEHEPVESLCRLSDATAVIDQQGRRIELLDEDNRQLRERVAELGAMLKIATNEREVAEINAEHWLNNLKNTQEKAREDRATHRAELAALKSAPVVMPERQSDVIEDPAGYDEGWNACLDKFESLNRSKT